MKVIRYDMVARTREVATDTVQSRLGFGLCRYDCKAPMLEHLVGIV